MASAPDQPPESVKSPRIPKLKSRNRPDPDAISPVDNTTALPPVLKRSNNSADRPSDDRHPHSPHGTATPTSPSSPWHDGSQRHPPSQEKRKRGVLSFFTLKEPSTSAWEEFVQQQRAEAGKAAKPPAIASKKLPDTVPKVNSKWDGLPKVAYERSLTSASGKRSTDVSRPMSKQSEESHKDSGSSNDRQLRSRAATSEQTSSPVNASNVFAQPGSGSRPSTKNAVSDSSVPLLPAMSVESRTSAPQDNHLTDFDPVPDMSLSFPSGGSATGQARSDTTAVSLVPAPGSQPQTETKIVSANPKSLKRILPETEKASPDPTPASQSRSLNKADPPDNAAEPPSIPISRNQGKAAVRLGNPSDAMGFPSVAARNEVPDQPVRIPSMPRQPQSRQPLAKSVSVPTLRTNQKVADGPADAPSIPVYRRRPQDVSSEPSADSSPYTPRTPEEPDLDPASRHSRKRSTEDAPQWPLPANKLDGTVTPPPIPSKSTRRSSVGSTEEEKPSRTTSVAEDSNERAYVEGLLSSPSRRSPTPPNGVRPGVRSFSRPLATAPPSSSSTTAVPMGTISIVRNQQMYTPSTLRAPPAFQPGRVVTKDSDLPTIPESDTASVHTLSAQVLPGNSTNIYSSVDTSNADRALRTTMDFSDTDEDVATDGGNDDDDDDDRDDDGAAAAAAGAGVSDLEHRHARSLSGGSRASSEMSDDWYKSPRERLGLGGFIRRNEAKEMLWPANGGSGEDAALAGAGERSSSRSGLRGVFKRT